MRQHILYAYVDGTEFPDSAAELAEHFSDFVARRHWLAGDARSVDQRMKEPDGEETWELGINLELPNPGEEPQGWFADVEAIAVFLRELAGQLGLEFVIGIFDFKRGVSEDLFFIDAGPIDIEALQNIIGVAPR